NDRLTATAGSLVEGTYFDTVRLRSVGAVGSPRDIPVRFKIYCPIVPIAPDTALAASIATTDCMARHQAGSFADYYVFSGNAGGPPDTSSMLLRATGHDANSGDTLRLQVEVEPLATAFLNSPTSAGSPVPNAIGGVPLSATVTNLTNGSYHWQTRVADQTGRL